MPSISVIVPVYQAEKFLRDCVESVRRQTFSDWELLLVDDGCTDGSPALCDELARTGGDTLHMTQEQVARYMGSAREVVSRMLKYFAAEGLVEVARGGIRVLDKERLRKMAL